MQFRTLGFQLVAALAACQGHRMSEPAPEPETEDVPDAPTGPDDPPVDPDEPVNPG
jgi:hypothetical protein